MLYVLLGISEKTSPTVEPRPKVLISSSEIKEKDRKGPYSDLFISEESYNYKNGKLITAFPTIPCTDLVGWFGIQWYTLTEFLLMQIPPTHFFQSPKCA